MKILQFIENGKEKTGLLEDNDVIELSCSSLEAINSDSIDKYKKNSIYKIEDIRLKSPVSPSKVICVGLNYRDHAAELNMDLPEEPIIFMKPTTTVIGHLDNIYYPDSSSQVDYEAEIGIIISKEAKNINSDKAREFIGGYTAFNDVTARDLQQKDGQWTRAKSFDTFAPIGPCIETDLDPMKQNISLNLNGELKQNSNTKNMIFDVYELVEFISSIMTLKPGDVIATGTPPGVGPMNVGDTVEVGLENIGILRNYVKNNK
ncbi:fumarylacetoacetate hydrolase family protein [Methanobacterium sp. ACI-7]|uniref:fumarylacetoacetate hydrolase family protein n=1 Tax=unclassified Methanobacterium TaxID=2627676 RepID=UPI0039C3DD33